MPVGSTLIASFLNNADAASYASASVTPANGTILTADCFLAATTNAGTPTMAGLGLTWNTILTDLDGGRSYGSFWALVAGSPTGALTLGGTGGDGTWTAGGLFLRENTNVDTTSPIFQSGFAGGDGTTSTTPTVVLANDPSGRPNNRVLMAVQHRLNAATTPRTNWTEPTNGGILADLNSNLPNSGFECQWRNDGTNEATASATIASARFGIWAYELAFASAGPAGVPIVRRRRNAGGLILRAG